MTEELDLYHEMRQACAEVLKKRGIKTEHCNFERTLSREQVRNVQIRAEYEQMQPLYGGAEEARKALGEKHMIRMKYLEKILYGA